MEFIIVVEMFLYFSSDWKILVNTDFKNEVYKLIGFK